MINPPFHVGAIAATRHFIAAERRTLRRQRRRSQINDSIGDSEPRPTDTGPSERLASIDEPMIDGHLQPI